MKKSKLLIKVYMLAGFGYVSGLILIGGLYHKNDSLEVLQKRCINYLGESWIGFCVALILVTLFMGRRLPHTRGTSARIFISFISVHLVVFLTTFFFFIGQTVLKGQVQNVAEFSGLLVYSLNQSWVGLLYCLPASIVATFFLNNMFQK